VTPLNLGSSGVREEFENPLGRGVRILRRFPLGSLGSLAQEEVPLDRRLDLVRGVGPHTLQKLKAAGYETLVDLARHPRFGPSATRVWAALARRDAQALINFGARDMELLPLFPRREWVVVDIETTGLAQVLPVFLIGVAYAGATHWEVCQYVAEGFEQEGAILWQAAEDLGGRSVCVTYNGKAFDEPFVRARFRFYGLSPLTFRLHVDLLHTCRRRFSDRFPNCRLATIAQGVLGIDRGEDITGDQAPDLYYRFLRDADRQALDLLLEHNAHDLFALTQLLDALWSGDFDWGFGEGEDESVS